MDVAGTRHGSIRNHYRPSLYPPPSPSPWHHSNHSDTFLPSPRAALLPYPPPAPGLAQSSQVLLPEDRRWVRWRGPGRGGRGGGQWSLQVLISAPRTPGRIMISQRNFCCGADVGSPRETAFIVIGRYRANVEGRYWLCQRTRRQGFGGQSRAQGGSCYPIRLGSVCLFDLLEEKLCLHLYCLFSAVRRHFHLSSKYILSVNHSYCVTAHWQHCSLKSYCSYPVLRSACK